MLSDRYDALDEAVHDGGIPFVELGSDGRIVYANAAFDALVPDRHGTPFPDLFGTRAADICAAPSADRNTSLCVDTDRRSDASRAGRDQAAATKRQQGNGPPSDQC